ncbi:hypothetical protein ACFFLE_11130, partial [Salinicoccus siamensis]
MKMDVNGALKWAYMKKGGAGMQIIGAQKTQVLDLINRFGVIGNKTLFAFFEGAISRHMLYKILRFLTKRGYIKKGNIGPLYYVYITPGATGLVSEPMHALRTLNQSELVHDLRVADYIIKQYLRLRTKDAVSQVGFTTERELIDDDLIEQVDATSDWKRSRNIDTVKRKVPDGYLHIKRVDGRKQALAIEYELTQKSKGKYEEILKRYARMYAHDELNGVVYIVAVPRIQRQIEAVRSSRGYTLPIKFHVADRVWG